MISSGSWKLFSRYLSTPCPPRVGHGDERASASLERGRVPQRIVRVTRELCRARVPFVRVDGRPGEEGEPVRRVGALYELGAAILVARYHAAYAEGSYPPYAYVVLNALAAYSKLFVFSSFGVKRCETREM